jgi:hypothetical protein
LVKPIPEIPEESVKPTPSVVNPIPDGNLPIPDGNLPIPLDSGTINTKDLRKGKPRRKPSIKQRDKAKPSTTEEQNLSRSNSSKPGGQEQAKFILQIAKAIAQEASFSAKAVSAIESLCQGSDFTLPELKTAVKARIETMDEFQLKNAGSALAANLLSDISEIRRQHKEAERIRAVLAETTAHEQAKAAEELAAVLAREQAESELIEEFLPG